MPKSKRAKIVPLTKTEKKGREAKSNLIEDIKEHVEKYSFVWLFSVSNNRNQFLKEIREDWKGRGRLFLGRNKVMAKAIGGSAEEELRPGMHQISDRLSGDVGLFFTNEPVDQVRDYFENFQRQDYARGGNIAPEDFVITEGCVMLGEDEKFPNSMEPQLRALGVPSLLKNGIVTLGRDFVVCREGDKLTHEQARLLKMFYKQMAIFRFRLLSYWHQDEFTELEGTVADQMDNE